MWLFWAVEKQSLAPSFHNKHAQFVHTTAACRLLELDQLHLHAILQREAIRHDVRQLLQFLLLHRISFQLRFLTTPTSHTEVELLRLVLHEVIQNVKQSRRRQHGFYVSTLPNALRSTSTLCSDGSSANTSSKFAMLLSVISFSISHNPRGSTAQIQHPDREHVPRVMQRPQRARERVDGGVGERTAGEIERVDGVRVLRVELREEERESRVADGVPCSSAERENKEKATRRAAVENEALRAQRSQLRQQQAVPRFREPVPCVSIGETGETFQVQERKTGETGEIGAVRGERAEQAEQRGNVRIVQVAL